MRSYFYLWMQCACCCTLMHDCHTEWKSINTHPNTRISLYLAWEIDSCRQFIALAKNIEKESNESKTIYQMNKWEKKRPHLYEIHVSFEISKANRNSETILKIGKQFSRLSKRNQHYFVVFCFPGCFFFVHRKFKKNSAFKLAFEPDNVLEVKE